MSNGALHAREREDLSLHVVRCAERYEAVSAEIGALRAQSRRIETAIWGIVAVLLALGLFGWFLEQHGIPVAPLILGLVLGEMLEQTFVQNMIKADGSVLAFFERPIAGALGVATIVIWVLMLARAFRPARRAAVA